MRRELQSLSAKGGGTIWNALRFALRIISGKIIYNFAILENLRIFQNCLFTGGVVTENGICSAAFCESAALWLACSPSQALTRQLSQRESHWHSGAVSG